METNSSFLILTQTCWKKRTCFPIPLRPMIAHDVRCLYLLFNPWHICFLKTRDNNSLIRGFKVNIYGVRQNKSNTSLWCEIDWELQGVYSTSNAKSSETRNVLQHCSSQTKHTGPRHTFLPSVASARHLSQPRERGLSQRCQTHTRNVAFCVNTPSSMCKSRELHCA